MSHKMLNLYPTNFMLQSQALEILKTGANVFLTGEPGAGKTHTINQYIAWLDAARLPVAVTASTGIAATHIGGMTIHSWSGIGVRETLSHYDLDKIATNEKTVRRVKKAKVLIIDEVSMLSRTTLDMVNVVTKTVRQSEEAFGGLQVIFVGDFFQLPPITKGGDPIHYAFESNAWQDAKPLVCYLTEQHRQEDELFLSLLQSIRSGEVEEEHFTLLKDQTDIEYENIEPTKLYTHNADVDSFNQQKLNSLTGEKRTFKMTGRGAKAMIEGLVRTCLSPDALELKKEAMVMCTKNNFEKGYVNGTLGRIVDFDSSEGWPIVEVADGRHLKMEPVSWEVVEDGKVRAGIEQVPLRLAWAITVHKSQGMSLDAAEMDLSKTFVYGQGYVALSRVRTLSGLKLAGMNPSALNVDPRVIRQNQRFQEESEAAEDAFKEMNEDDITKMQESFVKALGGHIPEPGDIKVGKPAERIKQASTQTVTKNLLEEGKSVTAIAKERSLTENTIWGHIEELAESGDIDKKTLQKLTKAIKDWANVYQELKKHMDKVGTEKLKPIFEAAKEKYDYNLIRLARIIYKLEN